VQKNLKDVLDRWISLWKKWRPNFLGRVGELAEIGQLPTRNEWRINEMCVLYSDIQRSGLCSLYYKRFARLLMNISFGCVGYFSGLFMSVYGVLYCFFGSLILIWQ
jgi:hypothetical protein